MYSDFEISTIFDRLWEKWPNKSGEASSKKAFTVALRMGVDHKEIERAVDLFVLDNIGADPNYVFKFGNFIREDHYKDTLENVSEDKLKGNKKEALKVMALWNKLCNPHWHQIASIEARLPMAMKALNDKAFHDNWCEALNLAHLIFKYQFRDDNPLSKINLSFRWFAETGYEKHTVLRIMEGHYGKPKKELHVNRPAFKNPDPKEMAKAALEMERIRQEMFGDRRIKPKEVILPKAVSVEVTDEAKMLVDTMKTELGKKQYVRKENKIEDYADQIAKSVGATTEEKGEEPDPFEFV